MIHQTYTLYMSYTLYWAIFKRWYMACTLLYIRHTPYTCRKCGNGKYSTGDTWLVHFYTSDIHPVHVVHAVLGNIQPVIHSLYTFIHQTYTLYMSYTRYWAIFNRWYLPCTLLYIRHTLCTCRIRSIGIYSTGDTWPVLLYIRHTPCTCRIHGIEPYSTGDTYPVHFYTSDIHPVHVVYAELENIQPVIHGGYTFIHQTYILYMSYTRYWAISNRWYMACTLLDIRLARCTCRIRSIGPYTTGDTWPVHFYTSDTHPFKCHIRGIWKYSTGDTWPVQFYTSDINPVHVVYALLGNIQLVIHGLYTFIHQTYTLYMSYMRYSAIFNRWYMTYTLFYIRHTPSTCRLRGIGKYTTGDTWWIHFYTSDIHPVHVVHAVLGHIQPVIHGLYTFIHQTHTLQMSYTRYLEIFNRWYMACTLLYIRHKPCTCRIRGIWKYTTGDTWPVHFYTSDIHMVHVVYAVFGHIQLVIHDLYTFLYQTYTLYMSFTRNWEIYNQWYMADTLLYIRHTPCTCRTRGIGPYSTGDIWPVHFYTSDIHPVHVVYAVLGHIQPLIHSLYTFIHQTFTLHMSYTRYWAIFDRWYISCTLLYIRYASCTCRLRGIGPYTNGDIWPVHIYTSDIHPVHVVYAVLSHIQPVIHSLYTFIH